MAHFLKNHLIEEDHGDGEVVSVLAFYSDDPSLNPTEANSFSVKFVFEKNEKNKYRPGFAHF